VTSLVKISKISFTLDAVPEVMILQDNTKGIVTLEPIAEYKMLISFDVTTHIRIELV
jgi:hypothetical protein